ncbi:CBS domain-containing protein [Leptolyngbya sp. AN02str]|uniref:CBS domain-containing protein n=1 Tax=Leptolyngbya sp. AN02str TaxID=3423363 RepID=UPI003D321C17
MDLILCHTTADFDTLGAAVGLTRLHPGARIVLAGGAHPAVRSFLALHRDEYALIERRAVNSDRIRTIYVVDTQWRDRLGKAAEWLDLPHVDVFAYDHHLENGGDLGAQRHQVEPVGATTTLIVEQVRQQGLTLNPMEATVMALGIHVDTGSLTYDHTTVRDAAALTWLMEQGANVRAIADYVEPGLSPQLQDLLTEALDTLHTETIQGYTLGWVMLKVPEYVPGLSSLTSQLATLTECDVLLLAARYGRSEQGEERVTVIGRSQGAALADAVNLSQLFAPMGGGGHPKAAALTVRSRNPGEVMTQLLKQLRSQIPHPPTARELMSSPVRTVRPNITIAEAQRILLRYGHSGLSVVDEQDQLVGIISRRDLDIALHHGFSHAPVKGYMTTNLQTITPDTTLPEIEDLMVTYDIGRLPVLDGHDLVGIVTRTDVLRQLHQQQIERDPDASLKRQRYCPMPDAVWDMLSDRLDAHLWHVLMRAAELAQERGWQLYMVGGSVRDLLLADGRGNGAIANSHGTPALLIPDIDLVVDGFHQSADQAAGVELARALQDAYPATRLQVHGRFQTAALLWHHDPVLDSLWVDIATARTEFYPYPAANPEVEASSIRQDLYRRDFTINALAIRLTPPRQGELLDFFGGLLDLQQRHIRVLHTNSFIEDPTRIYRAVRFAVRLGFTIEPQTENYIRHAIASGVYLRAHQEGTRAPALQTRLKRELKYILEAPYWRRAMRRLDDLGALTCLHPTLELDARLWRQMQLVDRGLKRFSQPEAAPALEHWQVLLELVIAHLAAEVRGAVAEGLQLAADSITRLSQLAQTEANIATHLAQSDRPSHVTQTLNAYDVPTLVLVGVRSSRPQRRLIWKYMIEWSQVSPLLNGNDLKQLGYKPGKQFKPMLDAVLNATLDGEVRSRQEAEAFLTARFGPPNEPPA